MRHFSRATKPRLALLRGLMVSLVENGRIKTTVERAKEVRRHIERAITIGKKGDVATRRLLLRRIPNPGVVKTIVDDLSVRFKARPGGYTRIIKIGRRPGDTAEMAFIEFVDHQWEKQAGHEQKDEKAAKKLAAKQKKAVTAAIAAKKKTVKKTQKKSRAAARA
ncbi:MAG: 50S ribosomal protein L17 [Bdellovibrionaceae bacterium]|nr:50S ribosomal protein L17 [Pseudobdellovibrionaceae bacterium]